MVIAKRTLQFVFALVVTLMVVACAGVSPRNRAGDERSRLEPSEVKEPRVQGDTDELVWTGKTRPEPLDVKPAGALVDTFAHGGTVTRLDGNYNRLITASPDRVRVWSLGEDEEVAVLAEIDNFSGTVTAISQPREEDDGLIAFGSTDGFHLYDYDLGQYLIDSYEQIHEPVKFFAGTFVAGVHNFEDGTSIIYVWSIRRQELYKRVYLDRPVSDFSIVITPIEEKHILSVVLRNGQEKVFRLDRGPVNEPLLLKDTRRDYLANHDQVNMNLSRGGFLIFSNPNGFYLFESRQSKKPELIIRHQPRWTQQSRWNYVPGPTQYGSLLVPTRNNAWDVYGLTREGETSHGQVFGRQATFIHDGSGMATADRRAVYVFDRTTLSGFDLLREIVRFKLHSGEVAFGQNGSGTDPAETDLPVGPIAKQLFREYFPKVFGQPEIGAVRYDSEREKFAIDIIASNKDTAGAFRKTLIVDYPVADPAVKKRLREQLEQSSLRVVFNLSKRGLEWDSALLETKNQALSLLPAENRVEPAREPAQDLDDSSMKTDEVSLYRSTPGRSQNENGD